MKKYCFNCGSELPTGAKFCSQCGKQQKQEAKAEKQIYNQSKVANRISKKDSCSDKDRLISDLERAHIYFQQKQSDYDDFDNLTNKKAEITRPNGGTLFLLGIVLAFVAYFVIYLVFIELDSMFLFWALMFIGGVIFPIIQFNKSNTKVNNQIMLIDQQLKGIEKDLHTHFNAYPNSPVSFKYSNPKIIDVLKDNISSGRADNVKDSISCMLDDLYKQQMLKKQDEISKNVKNAADSASAAALFSAGIFLNTRKK